MTRSQSSSKSREVRVDATVKETSPPVDVDATEKEPEAKWSATSNLLRNDRAMLKSMLARDKEKRKQSGNKQKKPRRERSRGATTPLKLMSIQEEEGSVDDAGNKQATGDEPLFGPYEDDDDDDVKPKKRKKKRKTQTEEMTRMTNDDSQVKSEQSSARTRTMKSGNSGGVYEEDLRAFLRQRARTKQSKKNEERMYEVEENVACSEQPSRTRQGRKKKKRAKKPRSSSFYDTQLQIPPSEEEPAAKLRSTMSSGFRQGSHGSSEISDLTSDSKAFEKAMEAMEQMRSSSAPTAQQKRPPSDGESKRTSGSTISDISNDAFEIAKQTVVQSDKELSGISTVWAEFDKWQSSDNDGECLWATSGDFGRNSDEEERMVHPKSTSISDLYKWDPFLDDAEPIQQKPSPHESPTRPRTESTAPRPSAVNATGESASSFRSSNAALTAPRSSFRQRNDNLDTEDDRSHDLLARYIQSLGADPQSARNAALSFAQNESELDARAAGRGNDVPLFANRSGVTYTSEGQSDLNLDDGERALHPLTDSDEVPATVNASSGGTRRHHRVFWPRFQTPGAVQMHTRAFGAPVRETTDQRCDIEEASEAAPQTVVLEARAVSDDETSETRTPRSPSPPIVYAEKLSFASWARHHRFFVPVGITIVGGLALAIVLAVLLTRDGSPANSTPSESPTSAPTFISRDLVQELERVSGSKALSEQGSPQRRAVGWLSSVDQSGMEASDIGLVQRYVMVVLYFATAGEQWIERENWLSPTLHECQWSEAINCKTDPSNRQIVAGLDLSRHGMVGELPPELGFLSQVEHFNVARNALTGTLPASLFNMTRLAKLDLHSNSFESSIPDTVSNAPFLVDLDLSKNMFGGEIPETLYDLSILRMLDVSVNQLTGILASGLGKLRVLTSFNIRSNLITGIIPPVFDVLSNLVYVHLDNNALTGNIPEWTGVLMRRQELTVAYNLLTGTIPGAPEGGLAALGGVTLEDFRLSKVDISNNRLSGTIPAEVAFIPSLRYIDFSNNPQLRGPFPSLPGVLSLWQSIEYLAASNCQLTGTVPFSFAPTLTHYIFHGNRLSGGFPPELCDLPELEYLSLAFNDIGGQIPPPVGTMKRLERLDLRACGLTGTIPSLEAMSSLARIDLSENALSGAITSEIGLVRTLTELVVHSNQLTGPLPSDIGSLTDLVVLDLRENFLTGQIPSEVGRCKDLDQVLLANNYFQGSVPESLCSLIHDLRFVDVGCQLECSCCSDEAEACAGTDTKAPPKNGTRIREGLR